MKKENNIWLNLIYFLSGSLVSYISLQFSFFDISIQLNIPELIMSLGTASVGLYIANTIQKKLTKNQNQFNYVQGKFDNIWSQFNSFSQNVLYNDNLEVTALSSYMKEAVHSINFVKNIMKSYNLEINCLNELENELENLEHNLLNLPIEENFISTQENKSIIENKIVNINQHFSKVLNIIHEI